MLRWQDCLYEACYTHIDLDGTQHVFAIDRLCRHVEAAAPGALPDVVRIPVEGQHVQRFLADNAIDPGRVREIEAGDLRRFPILFGNWPDGTQMLLDGRHRYVRAFTLGRTHIRALMLPHAVYEPFRVQPQPLPPGATVADLEDALRRTPTMGSGKKMAGR